MIPLTAAMFPAVALLAGADQGSQQSFVATIVIALVTSGGFWSVVLYLVSRGATKRREESETLTKSVRNLRSSSFLLIDAVEGVLVKLKPDDGGNTWSARLAGSEVEEIRREIRNARSFLYEGP